MHTNCHMHTNKHTLDSLALANLPVNRNQTWGPSTDVLRGGGGGSVRDAERWNVAVCLLLAS